MSKKLNPKEIKGKKFRKTSLNLILTISTLLFVIASIITFIADTIINIPVSSILGLNYVLSFILVCILSTFTDIFCVGKVFCILSEDRLYYFDSISTVGRRTENTCGYVGYSEIKNIELIKSSISIKRCMIKIEGDNFNILIPEASKNLIKQIKQKQEETKYGQIIPHYAEMEPSPERTGLLKEIWEDYENDELIKVFDSATRIESISNDREVIDITVVRNDIEILVSIDPEELFIYLENKNHATMEKPLSEIENMEHFYEVIEDFILKNT